MATKESSRRLRAARRAAGLCQACGAPARAPGACECVACYEEYGARRRKRYAANRAAGKCGTCGAPSPSRSLCDKCFEQSYAAGKKRKRAYREAGRCVDCGRPAVEGGTRCVECAAKWTEIARARFFGLTVPELRALLAPGKCAICGVGGVMHIDHDHETGRVRGILCEAHNLALGQFKDNPDHLIRAAEYLLSGLGGAGEIRACH